ncbi:hypothetical protein [Kribbella sp. NPDC004875]|uniref:hypothetical protein n=1 Tax=Kribbella sp. NPDC004875 TaxID=3364107 RepID=UPI00369D4042
MSGPAGKDVERIAIAEAAALAARDVAGVVRLQPGLVGLLRQFAAQAWERATGRPVPDIAGIDVEMATNGSIQVDARIVTAVDHHATTVGAAVDAAITKAVEGASGVVPRVRVRIVEIELEPQH